MEPDLKLGFGSYCTEKPWTDGSLLLLQTAIKLEQEDWTSERDPEMDVDQFFHTASPVTIYQMVDENLQVTHFCNGKFLCFLLVEGTFT